jgi:hypothetical protein
MQGSEAYRLIVRRGPQPNQVFELDEDVINLGRDITNHIVINDREVSRHHLRLMRGSDGYTIEDLGSTNGTFVNGKRVTGATPLSNGDLLGLGETVTLLYEIVGSDAPPPSDDDAPQATVQSASGADDNPERYQPPQPTPQASDNPYSATPADTPQTPAEDDAARAGYSGAPAPAQGQYPPPADYPQDAQPDPYYASAGAGYAPPPPAGYDYDPYAMRETEGGGMTQWLLIGCLSLILLCCCMTVVVAAVVDSFCLYDDIPILLDIINSLGIPLGNCPTG